MSPEANHYEALKTEAKTLIAARDAIDNCFSPEWREAHAKAREASLASQQEMVRLAKVDRTNKLGWQGPSEKELILKGWM
jgi:hypothetical protein